MCCKRASRPGYVAAGTAVAEDHMEDVNVKESHALVECLNQVWNHQLEYRRHLHLC